MEMDQTRHLGSLFSAEDLPGLIFVAKWLHRDSASMTAKRKNWLRADGTVLLQLRKTETDLELRSAARLYTCLRSHKLYYSLISEDSSVLAGDGEVHTPSSPPDLIETSSSIIPAKSNICGGISSFLPLRYLSQSESQGTLAFSAGAGRSVSTSVLYTAENTPTLPAA